MNAADDNKKFEEYLRIALYATGQSEIKLGNVVFWVDDVTGFGFDVPMSTWNKDTINTDLSKHVNRGVKRMMDAITKQ